MTDKTKTYRDLIVWNKSMDLVVLVYKSTANFPKSEIYGLVSQMRRSVVAIPSNVTEGYARGRTKEYAQFVSIAFASGAELETQLEIAKRLEYLTERDLNNVKSVLDEVMKMLNKLLGVLRAAS